MGSSSSPAYPALFSRPTVAKWKESALVLGSQKPCQQNISSESPITSHNVATAFLQINNKQQQTATMGKASLFFATICLVFVFYCCSGKHSAHFHFNIPSLSSPPPTTGLPAVDPPDVPMEEEGKEAAEEGEEKEEEEGEEGEKGDLQPEVPFGKQSCRVGVTKSIEHGEIIARDVCTKCQCDNGLLACFRKTCPTCPNGYAKKQPTGQCCLECNDIDVQDRNPRTKLQNALLQRELVKNQLLSIWAKYISQS